MHVSTKGIEEDMPRISGIIERSGIELITIVREIEPTLEDVFVSSIRSESEK